MLSDIGHSFVKVSVLILPKDTLKDQALHELQQLNSVPQFLLVWGQ